MSAALQYQFHAITDIGRARSNNEDAVAIVQALQVAMVADGMGGYNAGEVASALAVQTITEQLTDRLSSASTCSLDIRQVMQASVQQANQAIFQAALDNPSCRGMGTTLVLAVFRHDLLVLGHIGDSRCYRLRQGVLQQITRDHSWLQEQIDAGTLRPSDAERSPMRNVLTRALGVEPSVQVEINEFSVLPGDLFLLCSDGLTDRLDAEALTGLTAAALPLAAKAHSMVDRANALGGRDNISVVLVQALSQGSDNF